jgi:LuxR family transcriptional regulator, maltose regulon positive regulatory protein
MATLRGDILLATKISSPARTTSIVERSRLLARLRDAGGARLILVAAPAGFGKSTLLRAWLADPGVRGAWLSLDGRDNDVVRFSRYLAATTAGLGGSPGESTAFAGADAFDPELVLGSILGPIAAAGDAVVVLDDYHLIDERAVHRLVGTLLDRLPSRARLAIATRADPPLPIPRLRARGELLEIRAEDLRFTTAEAAELLRSSEVELAPPEIEALTDRTEGWAAALRLAAVSLHGRPDLAGAVRRFGASNRYVLDYVVEEVLAGLSPDTQDFLLRTSVLDRLSGPLCDAVTGGTGGQASLEDLERANLLITPLDDERRWYRYHALFAQILQARLAARHPDELSGLHARASAWHEQHGDDDQAIRHALQSGDLERTRRIVADASGRHTSAGELRTVRRWLDALPSATVSEDAQLSASYAWVLLLAGESEGVAGHLADAGRALEAGEDVPPMVSLTVPVQLAMLRSQLAGQLGATAEAIEQARLAVTLLPAGLPAGVEATVRGTAAALLGLALFRAGHLEDAVDAYDAALPDLRASGNWFAVGRAVGDLAAIAIRSGDINRALRLCDSELDRAAPGSPIHANATIWAAMARAFLELGQVRDAEAAGKRALELATRAGDAPSARSAEQTLARLPSRIGIADGGGTSDPRRSGGALVEALTPRELEVLGLVARGRTNRQIATELYVTVGTVKTHVHSISGKLGAANRVEAVARGRQLGLLD